MSRDYARSSSHSRGRARGNPKPRSVLPPFMIGLTLGLSVAVGVYLVDHGYVSLDGWPGDEHATPPTPVPKATEAPRPRFDFYTILPEMEVVIPEEPPTDAAAPRPAAPPVTTPADSATPSARGYVLQAGSFRSASDADALKAQLALLGYSASVQTVTINQDTYHRVRVGPFTSRERADAARAQLAASAVSTILLRLKG
jgi:cell division protein FtsN